MNNRLNRLKTKREQRQKRNLRLGGYLIVTDTEETEANYFNGFVSNIPSKYKDDLQIKIFPGKDLKTIIDFAESERNRDVRFRNVWIIFDRDKVKNFDELISDANQLDMNVGWSNPCFEIWMSAYFGKMKKCTSSMTCCTNFKKLLISKTPKKVYCKSDSDIYEVLAKYGNENKAIDFARKRHSEWLKEYRNPSDMIACSTVYALISEIRGKTTQLSV
ncbi:MAG: RloB family protein [Kiritimatiellae bacterium]|jgi:hypothetical protein|nr:RloB family protein [Kiritimatiellia bacterium]